MSDHEEITGGSRETSRAWLAKRLQLCLRELEERILVLIRGAQHEASDGEDAQSALGQRGAVVVCLQCRLIAIERGERWSGPVPPEVEARRAVFVGVSLATAHDRYIAALELAWSLVLQEAHAIEDPGTRKGLLDGAWASTASLFLCIIRSVTEAHMAESESRRKTRSGRDGECVLGLLAGRSDINLQAIDYDFDAYHLGLIAEGAAANDALPLLAKALGCRLCLIERENGSVRRPAIAALAQRALDVRWPQEARCRSRR